MGKNQRGCFTGSAKDDEDKMGDEERKVLQRRPNAVIKKKRHAIDTIIRVSAIAHGMSIFAFGCSFIAASYRLIMSITVVGVRAIYLKEGIGNISMMLVALFYGVISSFFLYTLLKFGDYIESQRESENVRQKLISISEAERDDSSDKGKDTGKGQSESEGEDLGDGTGNPLQRKFFEFGRCLMKSIARGSEESRQGSSYQSTRDGVSNGKNVSSEVHDPHDHGAIRKEGEKTGLASESPDDENGRKRESDPASVIHSAPFIEATQRLEGDGASEELPKGGVAKNVQHPDLSVVSSTSRTEAQQRVEKGDKGAELTKNTGVRVNVLYPALDDMLPSISVEHGQRVGEDGKSMECTSGTKCDYPEKNKDAEKIVDKNSGPFVHDTDQVELQRRSVSDERRIAVSDGDQDRDLLREKEAKNVVSITNARVENTHVDLEKRQGDVQKDCGDAKDNKRPAEKLLGEGVLRVDSGKPTDRAPKDSEGHELENKPCSGVLSPNSAEEILASASSEEDLFKPERSVSSSAHSDDKSIASNLSGFVSETGTKTNECGIEPDSRVNSCEVREESMLSLLGL